MASEGMHKIVHILPQALLDRSRFLLCSEVLFDHHFIPLVVVHHLVCALINSTRGGMIQIFELGDILFFVLALRFEFCNALPLLPLFLWDPHVLGGHVVLFLMLGEDSGVHILNLFVHHGQVVGGVGLICELLKVVLVILVQGLIMTFLCLVALAGELLLFATGFGHEVLPAELLLSVRWGGEEGVELDVVFTPTAAGRW